MSRKGWVDWRVEDNKYINFYIFCPSKPSPQGTPYVSGLSVGCRHRASCVRSGIMRQAIGDRPDGEERVRG